MGTKLHRRYTFLFTNHDPHEDAHKTCKYIHHPTYMQIYSSPYVHANPTPYAHIQESDRAYYTIDKSYHRQSYYLKYITVILRVIIYKTSMTSR
jgi:hypothetical protein